MEQREQAAQVRAALGAADREVVNGSTHNRMIVARGSRGFGLDCDVGVEALRQHTVDPAAAGPLCRAGRMAAPCRPVDRLQLDGERSTPISVGDELAARITELEAGITQAGGGPADHRRTPRTRSRPTWTPQPHRSQPAAPCNLSPDPTLLEHIQPGTPLQRQALGPTLPVVRTDALNLFDTDSWRRRRFRRDMEAGLIGINVPSTWTTASAAGRTPCSATLMPTALTACIPPLATGRHHLLD